MNYILVDYDNVNRVTKNRGLLFLVNGILSRLQNDDFKESERILIRLYGGWYESGNITKKAQDLLIEINKNFPYVSTSPNFEKKIIINLELAFSILIAKDQHLISTYRIRGYPDDLNCLKPSEAGCNKNDCPLNILFNFFTIDRCPKEGCNLRPKNFLYRGTQKLVDNMIASDIFYLCSNNLITIIVSSDEDFWPSIYYAIKTSNRVIHIHCKNNRQMPSHYTILSNEYYIERKCWEII